MLDRGSLEAAARVEDAGLGRGGEAFLLVELEGREGTELPWEETGKICAEAGAADVLVAEDRGLRDRIWKTRRAVTEGLRLLSPVHAKQDVSVPPAAIPAFIRRARAAAREERLDAVCFGHAGDGNIHLNLLGAGVPEAEWPERKTRAERRILEEALALGGVISGEHGIGLVKRAYLGLGYSPPAIDLMKALKRACDPRGILNPGKIFP